MLLPSPAHASPCASRQNHLLAALPAVDFERLSQPLERVPMPLGLVI